MKLKRAVAADADRIAEFEARVADQKLYGNQLDQAAATAEIEANQYYLLVADDRVVATGALLQRENGSVYLSNIAVLPQERRKGLARIMLQHLLSFAQHAPSIDLAVHPDNQPACALYASFGFMTGEIRDNLFGDGEPRMIMQIVRR